MKGLTESVKLALADIYANAGKWPANLGGKTSILGAKDKCVGLPTATDSWRMQKFTVDQYNTLFAKLVDGSVVVSNDTKAEPAVEICVVDYQT